MSRTKGQERITITLSEELLAAVDAARGGMSRSGFLRAALVEKLDLDEAMAAAPDRVGVGGRPTHKKKVYDLKKKAPAMVAEETLFTLPYLGAVAAGEPDAVGLSEVAQVRKRFARGHFVVRVSGESMEPELSDGDLIVCDARNTFTPGTGKICVVSHGGGSSVKPWNRKRGVFESLNPEFPDLEPSEETVFQGYFVEKVEEKE